MSEAPTHPMIALLKERFAGRAQTVILSPRTQEVRITGLACSPGTSSGGVSCTSVMPEPCVAVVTWKIAWKAGLGLEAQ